MYEPAVETLMGPATTGPTPGPGVPFTVDSDQEAMGALTSMDPAVPILLTKSRSDAPETWLAVVPGGSLDKSNRKSPWKPDTPPTSTRTEAPKLLLEPGWMNASPTR